jgi:cardiolipin synthase (CMP-forming)
LFYNPLTGDDYMTWQQFVKDVRKGWLPCSITLFGVFLIPFIIYTNINQLYILATALYTAAWIADGLDGWAARKYGASSETGAFLDPLADKIFTLSFILFFWSLIPVAISVPIITIAVSLTVLRIFKVQESKNKSIEFSIMAIKPGKIKTNVEKSGFALFLLAQVIFNELPAFFIVLGNIALASSMPFAFLSLTHQTSPETIEKWNAVYRRRFKHRQKESP